jgi:autotransporter-associated beta strand protein
MIYRRVGFVRSLTVVARLRLALLVIACSTVLIGPLVRQSFAGQYVNLGPSDPAGADQLGVQVALYTQPTSGSPTFLGPDPNSFANGFLLDTGSTTILSLGPATDSMSSDFKTEATYYESGIGGASPTRVSAPYRFDYAGTDGVTASLPSTRILTSQESISDINGIAGTPLMVGRNTSVDLTKILTDGTSRIAFSAAPSAGNGHRYDVPLQMVNFPLDGQQNPSDPVPTSAPLSMAAVQLHNGSHVVESHFLIDTGAGVSILSPAVANALGINLATDTLEYLPVQGIGGTVQMPAVATDSIAIHTQQGTDLKWTGLEVGVLDIDPQVAGVIGMDLLSSGWLNAFLFGGQGALSQLNFDFRNSANLTGDLLTDVDPGHDVYSYDGTWDSGSSGSYSGTAKWYGSIAPSGSNVTATFGNGVLNTINAPSVTVTVDSAVIAGYIVFNNTNGTGYILGNDGVAGHGITLNNDGIGANVSVASGVTALQQIQANLVLADDVTFDIAAGSSLLVTVGGISETGGSRSVTLTGGGIFTIDTPSSYTGTTTVKNGTLVITATGTLGSGPLVINAEEDSIASAVNLGSNQTISELSGTLAGTGTARVSVAAGTTLTVNQSSSTSFPGSVVLAAGPGTNGGGTLTKSGGGTLELAGAPSLANNSSVNVAGGTLRLNVTSQSSGSGSVGTGVTATITNQATLELAGSASALASGVHRVQIINNSTGAAGVLVTGTNQIVGNIDGSGTTQVNAGSDLTASHIVESALVIGGTANSKATVTIGASDAAGNPLATTAGADGLAFSNSVQSNGPLAANLNSSSMLGTLGDPLSNSSTTSGSSPGGAGDAATAATVPEPSSLLLAVICLIGGCYPRLAKRRS